MGRLLLVRHGESEGNRDRLFTAHPDVPLTEAGQVQARRAGERLMAGFAPARVVSSPFLRARQTAAIIGEVLGLAVEIEPDLHERSYGTFAGQSYEAIRGLYDHTTYWTWRPPEGETLLEVAARAGAALDRLARAAPQTEVVVVSHGAVMQALWVHATRAPRAALVVPNAGLVVIEHREGEYLGARLVDER